MTNRDLDELRIDDASDDRDAWVSPLSISPEPRTVRGSPRWQSVVSRITAPVLAWFALGLVVFGSQHDTDYDLQLTAPEAAQPNQDIPLRALFYEKLRSVEGPSLSPRKLDVLLEDRAGKVLARTRLAPARAGYGDIEGVLRVPGSLQGEFRLHAITVIDSLRVEVQRPLRIGEPARYAVQGRPLRALQQFSEGPLQPEAGEVAPDVLRVRVGGGACVPEEECHVFVHVGTPAATVWVEGNSTVTPQSAPASPRTTSSIVALTVITHGPEAQLWLRASRACPSDSPTPCPEHGRQVAHRSIRLPVALGAAALRVKKLIVAPDESPAIALLGGEGGCVVDVFDDGRWVRSGSAPSCTRDKPPPTAALAPGVYRIQARRDPYASSMAGVALCYVLAPGETRARALRELAGRVAALDSTDRFARSVMAAEDSALPLDAPSFGYLAAALETGVIELPRPVSGYAATLERLAESQAQLRWLSIIALVLGALSLALSVGIRGLRAAARADALLLDAGHTGQMRRRARARAMLSLAFSVLSLMLVFVVLGAYVVARAGP